MKTLSIDQVITSVRKKYEEIDVNESGMIATSDDANFNTVVESCIADAYRFVMLSANTSLLEGKQLTGVNLTVDDNMVGRVALPSDFLRGVTVRLSSWQSSPSDIITEDTPQYRMQSDKYACGTYQEPVAALVHTATGRTMELYKAKTKDDTIKSFVYVPSWDEGSSNVQIPDQLANAFIYYVAALTATTFREDVANDFFKVARSLLGLE